MSSPTNPILSFGMSRGPSPEPLGRVLFGLEGPGGGPAIGAREAPAIREPKPGTVLVPSVGFGGVLIGPRVWTAVGGVCFSM